MMSYTLTQAAPAKINLYLHVTGQRDDGYHFLDSAVCFTEFADTIHVRPDEPLSFSIEGAYSQAISNTDNLIFKAIEDFANQIGNKPVGAVTLEKNIPVSAGLGGGSSDAAAIIKLYEKIWGVKASAETLLGLGADVPVCYHGETVHMSGIGEKLATIHNPFIHAPILLVNPNKPLSTQAVFKKFDGPFCEPLHPINAKTISLNATNTLEKTAISLCPDIIKIEEVLSRSKGLRFCRMAGSGPTVFGVFDNDENARLAKDHLTATNPNWWIIQTYLK